MPEKTMIEVEVTEFTLTKECEEIAREAWAEQFLSAQREEINLTDEDDEPTKLDPDDYRDDIREWVEETIDSHRWVIYTRYPREAFLTCNLDVEEYSYEDGCDPDAALRRALFDRMVTDTMEEIDRLAEEWEDLGSDWAEGVPE